ncbi:protein RAFTIN 1B isoform X2 [Cajanus cajan]|uniref:protein RAFTIN 1B isoform X2 n=1 Tax=Cajanus cajan TaxID=3821 RepID=UPI0010FB4522|nr:protein RAFTIN 1B isoform X2 [Cajanus cajan]
MPPNHFLSLFLLFLLNGHIIGARDLKFEQRDQKQVEWHKATSVSNDESYGQGYITLTPESTEPNYIASYTAKKHNHHHEKLHQPYTTYDSNAPYIAGYTTSSHVTHNHPNYIAGYRTKTHDSNAPYIAEYSHVTHNQPNYISGYRTKTHDSNAPYIAGYSTTSSPVTKNDPNYISAYKTKTSHQAYITAYGSKKAPNESSNDDITEPYLTQYGDSSPKDEPNYIASYKAQTSASVAPYVGHTHQAYITSHDDTTEPYITQYGRTGPPKIAPKESSKEDHTEAFKTGFLGIDDLHVGNVMTLQFPIQEIPNYLPRKEADSIPFSTSQLPSVLQLFSIPEDSPEANAMSGTLDQCEAEPINGETKTCATSLESMLEFVGTILGSEVKYNILTTSYPKTPSDSLQKYTILEISEDINAPKWVACHPQPYPYAVYYCHFISTGTKVFKVSLGSENGNKIEALGVCHLDTSEWSPDHIIFKQLGIKPGKAPVCHFFPVTHLMWVPQTSQATN